MVVATQPCGILLGDRWQGQGGSHRCWESNLAAIRLRYDLDAYGDPCRLVLQPRSESSPPSVAAASVFGDQVSGGFHQSLRCRNGHEIAIDIRGHHHDEEPGLASVLHLEVEGDQRLLEARLHVGHHRCQG